jgi:hypothetical protein
MCRRGCASCRALGPGGLRSVQNESQGPLPALPHLRRRRRGRPSTRPSPRDRRLRLRVLRRSSPSPPPASRFSSRPTQSFATSWTGPRRSCATPTPRPIWARSSTRQLPCSFLDGRPWRDTARARVGRESHVQHTGRRQRAPRTEQRLARSRQAQSPASEPPPARRRRSRWWERRVPPTGEALRARCRAGHQPEGRPGQRGRAAIRLCCDRVLVAQPIDFAIADAGSSGDQDQETLPQG